MVAVALVAFVGAAILIVAQRKIWPKDVTLTSAGRVVAERGAAAGLSGR